MSQWRTWVLLLLVSVSTARGSSLPLPHGPLASTISECLWEVRPPYSSLPASSSMFHASSLSARIWNWMFFMSVQFTNHYYFLFFYFSGHIISSLFCIISYFNAEIRNVTLNFVLLSCLCTDFPNFYLEIFSMFVCFHFSSRLLILFYSSRTERSIPSETNRPFYTFFCF